jgi:DNA-binding transcriptional LysR family regulator
VELRQIEHFIAVAGEMSFTRAAERAHVVQSALSTSIAKLERELGVELFDRSRQRISLTAAGEAFRSHAYEVLHAARAAAESAGQFRGSLMGTVEFGSLISYGPVDVGGALGDFHRAHRSSGCG